MNALNLDVVRHTLSQFYSLGRHERAESVLLSVRLFIMLEWILSYWSNFWWLSWTYRTFMAARLSMYLNTLSCVINIQDFLLCTHIKYVTHVRGNWKVKFRFRTRSNSTINNHTANELKALRKSATKIRSPFLLQGVRTQAVCQRQLIAEVASLQIHRR